LKLELEVVRFSPQSFLKPFRPPFLYLSPLKDWKNDVMKLISHCDEGENLDGHVEHAIIVSFQQQSG
jgi:hypothetical protein